MILAHSFIGAPITYQIIKNKELTPKFKNLIYFVGITGAILPDFDLLLTFFIKDLNHRQLVSHSIIPYLILYSTLFLISLTTRSFKKELQIFNNVLFLTIFSHLFIDALVGSIALFGPFDKTLYGIPVPFGGGRDFFVNYFNSYYTFFELAVISLFFIFLKNYQKIPAHYLAYFYFFVALAMVFKYSLI
jgi:hypothetical protein